MSRRNDGPEPAGAPLHADQGDETDDDFRVEDRRHWAADDADEGTPDVAPRAPSLIDDYRLKAESAEQKLQEYIEAYKASQLEQDEVRARLERDVDRRVGLKFGPLVGDLLETMDALDLSLSHTGDASANESLIEGLRMVHSRFLSILGQNGVERIAPDGEPFDPTVAEAVRIDAVEDPDSGGRVTETLQPGYRLGELVIRAAKVAVSRCETPRRETGGD